MSLDRTFESIRNRLACTCCCFVLATLWTQSAIFHRRLRVLCCIIRVRLGGLLDCQLARGSCPPVCPRLVDAQVNTQFECSNMMHHQIKCSCYNTGGVGFPDIVQFVPQSFLASMKRLNSAMDESC